MFGFTKVLFDTNEKQIKKYQKTVDQITALENEVSNMTFQQMKDKTLKYREELTPLINKIRREDRESIQTNFINGKKSLSKEELAIKEKLLEFMPHSFAMVREVAKRKMGRRHFDVQLIGGIVLSEGKIAELKTGEGKTQTAHLPLYLYGLTGRGTHLVTVNDYLTKRDGEYAGHILSELGLTVGIVTSDNVSYKYISDNDIEKYKGEEIAKERLSYKISNPGDVKGHNLIEVTKKDAYACDVVYGTNNEFGFDYLRDNMANRSDDLVQGELYYCIVDEVDSILIDEARTPLIISTSAEQSNELYYKFAQIVKSLVHGKDFEVDEKTNSAVLTDEGSAKVEKILGVKNLWEDYQLAHHLENALKAEALFKIDDEYLVRDGQIIIIDEFTGRALPGRRYSEGLHQAIEAKEGVEIQKESKTLATITFQNFFRVYKHLSGTTGTAETEAEEFFKIYGLDTVVVPTVNPLIRIDQTDRVYRNKEAKFKAVVKEIIDRNKKGQPMLVGTTSVENSELLSSMLQKDGIKHQVLNAKQHEKEAQIVARAGEKSSVTIATNMAGRGTDIKIDEVVKDLGGLYVIGTERHESRRIDNQLRGRSGRLGDPGESRFFVALDDEIMRIQGGDVIKGMLERTNLDDSVPIEVGIIGKSIENAQKRMEGSNFDIRKQVVEYDDVMNQQRMIFYQRRRKFINLADDIDKEDRKVEAVAESIDIAQRGLKEFVANIINKHFFAINEEGEIDKKQIIEDFKGIADDSLLNEANKKAFGEKDLSSLVEEDLTQEEMQEILETIALGAFDTRLKKIGDEEMAVLVRNLYLQTMDQSWTDHLEAMQDLRAGIGLRGMAQRDPLVEYKQEGFNLFESFLRGIELKLASRLLKVEVIDESQLQAFGNIKTNQDQVEDILTGSREMLGMMRNAVKNVVNESTGNQPMPPVQKTVVNEVKVGRNDPCPCGSGKKYKKCHGKLD